MNNFFGKVNLVFSIPVHNQDETLALMEANHKLNIDNLVGYEFKVINAKGEEIQMNVHNIESIDFDEFVEV
jgi:hypothetical protein